MSFLKKLWKNGKAGGTPLDADGLNDLENRIFDSIFKIDLAIVPQAVNANDLKNGDYDKWKSKPSGIYLMYNGNEIANGYPENYIAIIHQSLTANTFTQTIVKDKFYYTKFANATINQLWEKYIPSTNKGSNQTGGSGLTYSQIMDLPIGWSGIAKFSMLTPNADYYAIKLMASTTGNTSIWVLMAQNDSQIFKYVCFSPNSVIFDKDLLTGNHIKDYVVEQGETNGIYWEKWNSGKCELRGSGTIPSSGWTQAASGGFGGYYSSEVAISLPFALVSTDAYINAVLSGSRYRSPWVSASEFSSTTKALVAASQLSSSFADIPFKWEIKGRWK